MNWQTIGTIVGAVVAVGTIVLTTNERITRTDQRTKELAASLEKLDDRAEIGWKEIQDRLNSEMANSERRVTRLGDELVRLMKDYYNTKGRMESYHCN